MDSCPTSASATNFPVDHFGLWLIFSRGDSMSLLVLTDLEQSKFLWLMTALVFLNIWIVYQAVLFVTVRLLSCFVMLLQDWRVRWSLRIASQFSIITCKELRYS